MGENHEQVGEKLVDLFTTATEKAQKIVDLANRRLQLVNRLEVTRDELQRVEAHLKAAQAKCEHVDTEWKSAYIGNTCQLCGGHRFDHERPTR